jgi:predicted RNA-binding Zn ribbon-like protein
MVLASYSDAGVQLMVDLANSYDLKRDPPEQLPDAGAWQAFLERHHMLGPNQVHPADVDELTSLRASIRNVFAADITSQAIDRLNTILADAGTRPWLAEHADGSREVFFAPPEAPLARRVACDAGIGLAMMMINNAERLKTCAANPCRNVFIDTSRNRSRRWCSQACAARMNVAAYRARQHATTT